MEENWLDHVEYDNKGKLIMGADFIRYKENVTTLREVVERHFNTAMQEILNGLPSIENDFEDDSDYTFDGNIAGTNWTCRVCQVKNLVSVNGVALTACSTCGTPKPNLKFESGNRTSFVNKMRAPAQAAPAQAAPAKAVAKKKKK